MIIKLVLARKDKNDSFYEIEIKPSRNNIGKKWVEMLKLALKENLQIEKNFCWLGFPDNPRNLEFLCYNLNYYVAVINKFSESSGWKEKKYQINDFFTPDTVVQDGDVNHVLMNSIHHHFEILQGQVWNVSPWLVSANDEVRFAIRQLNNLCHEIEILIKAKKMQRDNPERVSPATILSFINPTRIELEPEDYDHFTLDRGFGKVFMHYCQTGKTHWEAFVDGDQQIDRTNISGLRYSSSEFNIEWGPDFDNSISWWVAKKEKFREWLVDNDYEPNDKLLSLGWLHIGQVNTEKIFNDVGSRKLSDVHSFLSDYLDIAKIEVVDGDELVSCSYQLIENNDYLLSDQFDELKKSYKTLL